MTSMGSCTMLCTYVYMYVCMQPIREKKAIDPDHGMMIFFFAPWSRFSWISSTVYKVCTEFISQGRIFFFSFVSPLHILVDESYFRTGQSTEVVDSTSCKWPLHNPHYIREYGGRQESRTSPMGWLGLNQAAMTS